MENSENLFRVRFAFAGAFSAFCAWRDFDWFMESRKAGFFVGFPGRNGAKTFYIVFGLLLILFAYFFPLLGADRSP